MTIITSLFSIICFAHKDKTIFQTYGNVKVYMRTGFEYSDIDKIIGQLSEKTSKKLHYIIGKHSLFY